MFGYVMADRENLCEEDAARYKSYYCGLCRTMGKNHGFFSRTTLTYDMTFLTILLSDIYCREDTVCGTDRCVIHPVKKHNYTVTSVTEYAAAMNVALAYYNCIDDWYDDKNVIKGVSAALLKNEYLKIRQLYPRQCKTIEDCIERLSNIESAGELNPDVSSGCFGELLGELFVYKDDAYREILYDFGFKLGKFVYIMDACCDLKTDLRKRKYNPMVGSKSCEHKEILDMLSESCNAVFEKIEAAAQDEILKNILYSGIWLRYMYMKNKEDKKANKRVAEANGKEAENEQ